MQPVLFLEIPMRVVLMGFKKKARKFTPEKQKINIFRSILEGFADALPDGETGSKLTFSTQKHYYQGEGPVACTTALAL